LVAFGHAGAETDGAVVGGGGGAVVVGAVVAVVGLSVVVGAAVVGGAVVGDAVVTSPRPPAVVVVVITAPIPGTVVVGAWREDFPRLACAEEVSLQRCRENASATANGVVTTIRRVAVKTSATKRACCSDGCMFDSVPAFGCQREVSAGRKD
jgi:hypothetical protein